MKHPKTDAVRCDEEVRLAELLQLRRRVLNFEDWQQIRQAGTNEPRFWRFASLGKSGMAGWAVRCSSMWCDVERANWRQLLVVGKSHFETYLMNLQGLNNPPFLRLVEPGFIP